jgi:hypothetical protein|tara:strand:- start:320 stop:868 length:549 start_codon:yes stop_codon:yes gene_type:complete
MKGVIFTTVEEIVVDLFDAHTWDDLLESAGLDGAYTALGNYGEDELVSIVTEVAAATNQGMDDVWRLVGRLALPKLASRIPTSMVDGHDARTFLLSVNEIIHPEVRMIYPDAIPPVFTFTEGPDEELLVVYRSTRRLDALAEGLMVGCGDLFKQPVEVTTADRTGLSAEEARFRVRVGLAPQ